MNCCGVTIGRNIIYWLDHIPPASLQRSTKFRDLHRFYWPVSSTN